MLDSVGNRAQKKFSKGIYMAIIEKLGIDSSAWIQFFIFGLTVFILSKFVFSHFIKAFDERVLKTKDVSQLQTEYKQKTLELHNEYTLKAREISGDIHDIFEKEKAQAMLEYDKIIGKAKGESSQLVEESSKKISEAIGRVMSEIANEKTQVALAITSKLLGKQ